MTSDDLASYSSEWVDPISTTYRGWNVYELPPNTQGIAALMMLNMMEQYPLTQYGLTSTKSMHVMIEAKKLAYSDMIRYVADPKFAKVPTALYGGVLLLASLCGAGDDTAGSCAGRCGGGSAFRLASRFLVASAF